MTDLRCSSVPILVLVTVSIFVHCSAAPSSSRTANDKSRLVASLLRSNYRDNWPDTTPSTGESGNGDKGQGKPLVPLRVRRVPHEEILFGPTWKEDDEGDELLDEDLLERFRARGPAVLSDDRLEKLLTMAGVGSGGDGDFMMEGGKSRNGRNRAHHDMEVLGQLVEMYSLKRKRGEGPQVSVVAPLDVLRQQLIYELARRRMKEREEQFRANEEFIKSIGKRSVHNETR
ncbi:Diuretic hormone [Halotydeus destructor]|nr:Diuretic hormone [Halotydeus destructor]